MGLQKLLNERERACRLVPELALQTLDEAESFLRERGLLTRTADCALPSLFEACHEEPYKPGSRGFGLWPRTKWPWAFELADRQGVHVLGIHRGKGSSPPRRPAGSPTCSRRAFVPRSWRERTRHAAGSRGLCPRNSWMSWSSPAGSSGRSRPGYRCPTRAEAGNNAGLRQRSPRSRYLRAK
jgi:hypothetical protein